VMWFQAKLPTGQLGWHRGPATTPKRSRLRSSVLAGRLVSRLPRTVHATRWWTGGQWSSSAAPCWRSPEILAPPRLRVRAQRA